MTDIKEKCGKMKKKKLIKINWPSDTKNVEIPKKNCGPVAVCLV